MIYPMNSNSYGCFEPAICRRLFEALFLENGIYILEMGFLGRNILPDPGNFTFKLADILIQLMDR